MAAIENKGSRVWKNYHESVSAPVQNFYVPLNDNNGTSLDKYIHMSEALGEIIEECLTNGQTIRAVGGKWALSPIAYDRQSIIETNNLNLRWRPIAGDVNADFISNTDNLVFAQCGTQIKSLNIFLRDLKKSLSAHGASNGQTVAGAISCGTHGAALDFGSIHDSVVGIHIIVNKDKSYYIQKASRPIIQGSFTNSIKAELINDDALFNAALVSMGCFGFIHGVMFEVEDWFLLRNYSLDVPQNQARELIDNLNFDTSAFQIPSMAGKRPYHFKVHFNPYDTIKPTKAEILYKELGPDKYERPPLNDISTYHKDTLSIIASLSEKFPAADKKITELVFKNLFKQPIQGATALLIDTFGATTTKGKTFSTAIGVDHKNSSAALSTLRELIDEIGTIPAIFALRFVKGSDALMAFTRFPVTCVLEIDAVRNQRVENFIKHIPQKLRSKGIPFTFHWGKDNPMDKEMINEMYGSDFVQWKKQKSKIMNSPEAAVWSSDYARRLGLDGWKGNDVDV